MVTIFKTLFSVGIPYYKDIDVVFERIKNGKSKDLCEKIRNETDKTKRDALKQQLPAICFSGTFRLRSDNAIIDHSGFICLDFDKLENVQGFKDSICDDDYTYAAFISPSGNGVKVIVKVPKDVTKFKKYFEALKLHYNMDEYWDESSKNISRVCFESYDPNIYINNDSKVWDKYEVDETYDISIDRPILPLTSQNGIIKRLEVWFNKKYSVTSGQRNSNLFILAAAFNDYGIYEHEAKSYFYQFSQTDFTQKEIDSIIKSAYSKKESFGKKQFQDNQTIDFIQRKVKSGTDKKRIIKEFEKQYEPEVIEDVIENINETTTINEFWYFDDKGRCHIKHYSFKQFLEQRGFFKLYPSDSKGFVFIQVENNLIENTTNDKVKDFVLKYLELQQTMKPYELAASSGRLFKDDYLNLIDVAKVSFFEDTIDRGVLYYKNGALVVTKRGYELIDYLDLDGFVWRDQIINREFVNVDYKGCVFERFLLMVSGNDVEKMQSMKSVIGYLLHSFKTSANNKAIIINDETISDNPNGGSGKGIFWNALKYMKKVVDIDGKQFDFNKSFIYQRVTADTQVLVFDDVRKNFEFEFLFSLITEGITIERKNKDAIKIPIEKSPKILITTNYTVGGVGGSFDRRKWEIEFSSHFNSTHTPLQEFGHLLFDEWSEIEWNRFDSFMISCLQLFLTEGLIKQEFKNLEVRKLHKQTSFEFIEWCEEGNLPFDTILEKPLLFEKFVSEYQDFKKWLTAKKFKQWIDIYAAYHNAKSVHGNTNGKRWVNIQSNDEVQPTNTINDEDAPF